jgi:cation diffusion facilitator family transporter
VWSSIKHFFAPHSHDVSDSIDSALEDSRLGERITKQTLVIKVGGAAIQLAIVAISGSLALMADMIHSFADASTTIPLWIAFVMGRRGATKRFPYGYRRAEDLVGVFIILVIMSTAGLVIWESYQRLVSPEPILHLPWVTAAAIVGIIVNEYVARLRIRVGRKIGSSALVADGLHARTDTLSSGAVLIAVAGVALGYDIVDSLVGFVVAAIILWMMKDTALQILRRLMDGIDEGTVDEITAISGSVDGVERVDAVRARWSGHRMMVEVIISVAPEHTVAEGHLIAEHVRHQVLHDAKHVHDVLVHVNPAVGEDGDDPHGLTRHHHAHNAEPTSRRPH